jgi:2-amino-4-hydroxy-6-hydroxymethyldihydropteridine diphosphokinase
MHLTYLSLGTNLGDRRQNLQKAIEQISAQVGPVKAQSSFIETEPWGFASDHLFLNAAISVETPLSPHALLRKLQTIERQLGRKEKTPATATGEPTQSGTLPPYQDRVIDIDILLYYENNHTKVAYGVPDWGGSIQISTPNLTIPHPYMHQRDFVLKPLKEIL